MLVTLSIICELAVGILVALCLTGQPAKAYADPASLATIWQVVFATIVSVGFHFRKVHRWLLGFRTRRQAVKGQCCPSLTSSGNAPPSGH